ncbi:hypothetical protein [uncultured Oscillibacter sp.]|uniref:hypothetical protein n=1 Tax=uncultured Oscillibacter sp. TaxID=876091 RepID=UPI002638121A|nr:hypothetical protein [uncultured Oscillibacter sp.]
MMMELNAITVASFCFAGLSIPKAGGCVHQLSRNSGLISRKKLRQAAPPELMFPFFAGRGTPQNL